jgi:diketogulonate reductase-like aldo/keto reductase
MEFRRFGPTNRDIAAIGQGTWYRPGDDLVLAANALRLGLDLGLKHIDTAEMYLAGGAEELIGQVIKGRRDEVFLVSKVLPSNASTQGTVAACERSLTRLNTDRLDCYLLHWRGSIPLVNTIIGFEELRVRGKILSWGVSNFDVPDLEEVVGIVGEGRLACNQVLYNLEERAIEHRVLPWCEKHGVAVVGYSPFGSGKFPHGTSPEGRVLEQIARAHNATPRQVALRFLLRFPSLFTIPKATKPEHVEENAGAADLRLTEEELAKIDEVFPRGPVPRELPMI